MRASALRTKIIDSIESIVPDVKVSSSDIFRSMSTIHDQSPIDRMFILERSAPQAPARELLTTLGASPDPYSIRWVLQVFYVNGEHAIDRVLDDGDLVVDALRSLTSEQQIRTIDIAGSSDLEDEQIIVSTWDLTVTYDRREP